MNDNANAKVVRTIKAKQKVLRKKLEEWDKKSKKEGIPICLSCARWDYDNGRLKDYKYYTKGFEEINRNVSEIKESGGVLETPIKYILIDYKCPKGHGVSMHIRYEDYLNTKKEKSFRKKGK